MKPIIAITAGEIKKSGDEWAPITHGQSHTYTDAVTNAGGAPFIVPIFNDIRALRRLYEQCQGLLFSGGNDIDPVFYRAEKTEHSKDASPKRDKHELQLLRWALDDNKPVLGICRGMQLINIALGGNLHQDINAALPKTQNHQISAHNEDFSHLAHRLSLKPGSRLAHILGVTSIHTNALHHQAIKTLGHGLAAVAYAEDGIIEAVEHSTKRFVIGVQSHPEALVAKVDSEWHKLFNDFIEHASLKQAQPALQPARLSRGRLSQSFSG